MKKLNYYILFFFIFFATNNILISRDFDYRDIPVQENGRIKPLDTFVKNQLLSIYSKRSLKSKALPKEINQKT